jgi:hypothetical protein
MFCAICTDEIRGVPRREPLGKNGAMVNVCDGCALEMPVARERRGGYEAPGLPTGNSGKLNIAATHAMKRHGVKSDALGSATMRDRTTGWLLVRVARRDTRGRSRDVHEAVLTLKHQPWYRELRFLGLSPSFICFERPDPKALTRVESVNPLAALEPYRTEPTP